MATKKKAAKTSGDMIARRTKFILGLAALNLNKPQRATKRKTAKAKKQFKAKFERIDFNKPKKKAEINLLGLRLELSLLRIQANRLLNTVDRLTIAAGYKPRKRTVLKNADNGLFASKADEKGKKATVYRQSIVQNPKFKKNPLRRY